MGGMLNRGSDSNDQPALTAEEPKKQFKLMFWTWGRAGSWRRDLHTIVDDDGSTAVWLRQRLLSAIGLRRCALLKAHLFDGVDARRRIGLLLARGELAQHLGRRVNRRGSHRRLCCLCFYKGVERRCMASRNPKCARWGIRSSAVPEGGRSCLLLLPIKWSDNSCASRRLSKSAGTSEDWSCSSLVGYLYTHQPTCRYSSCDSHYLTLGACKADADCDAPMQGSLVLV